jgi:hypothetical protein
VLFLRSIAYDPASRILTVRFRAPSGSAWATYEYRDVPAELYERMLAAAPHAHRVVERDIAPSYDVRRLGEHAWRPPAVTA